MNLGGLYISQLQTDRGLPLVQQALTFFQQANYPKDVFRCLTQIARANRRKGDYSAALQAINQKLEIAQRGGNQPAIADCYVEAGAVLFEQDSFPEALEQYNKAHDIYQALGNRIKSTYSQANRGNILWRLGRYGDARAMIGEVAAIADQPQSDFKQLIPALRLVSAQLSLSERNLSEAKSRSSEAIGVAGTEYPDTAIEGTFTLGLAKALSGAGKEAQALCEKAVRMANDAGDFALTSRAMLAQAEAALESGNAQAALATASQAQERFARGSQLESEWRAWLIAARANQRLGDTSKAQEQLAQGKSVLSRLAQKWGAEVFNSYTSRPDIQVYYKQLG